VLAKEPCIRVEYFEIVDAETMQPAAITAGRMCIAAAIWLGSVRLIDNVFAFPFHSKLPFDSPISPLLRV
jgi:pantoate--beta-alanine ligase